jgi:signal transduction histidine kinase
MTTALGEHLDEPRDAPDARTRVLVVDDDELDRRAVRRALARAELPGLAIEEAPDARTAIEMLTVEPRATLFDVVLLDYDLAGDTGIDVLGALREHGTKVPVVMLTGTTDPITAAASIKAGATDFLTKDLIAPDRLAQVIRAATRVGQVEASLAEANKRLREQAEELEQQVDESLALTEELERANELLYEAKEAAEAVAKDNARLYEAEQRARANAEQANKAKSEFLANMSHELRTPLNAIGGYTDLIVEGIRGPITDAQRADLDRIKRNQLYLLSLINDILNFAKLEAGRVSFVCKPVSMNESLGQLEALVRPQLEQKQIRYEYQCCDAAFKAQVDPERLQQILLNLLSNAIKFTPPRGEILVLCRARPVRMEVRVKDTGVGIPRDKLESIFEPFVQLDRGQPAGNVGTGLGLAISRDLARAMGGDLRAKSTVGQGSTFILSLPRVVE